LRVRNKCGSTVFVESMEWEINMSKVLSIVIPSYNTEKFIDECLSSMLDVGNLRKIEILLVNDGSTDCTKEIAESYESRYPGAVRVINKSNGGHGSCVNRGIDEARGKYFKIVDGDDWVECKGLDKLVTLLENSTEDVVINSVIEKNISTGKTKTINYNETGKVLELSEYLTSGYGEISLPAMTIKTSILQNNSIRVREKCFYEDTEYILYPIPYVKTIRSYSFPVYVYRVGQAAQSINPERAFRNRSMLHLIVEDCIDYFYENENRFSGIVKEYIAEIVGSRIITMYNNFFKVKINKEIVNEIVEWDQELKSKSEYFYKRAGVFPISYLRKNIKRRAFTTYLMYKVFFAIRQR